MYHEVKNSIESGEGNGGLRSRRLIGETAIVGRADGRVKRRRKVLPCAAILACELVLLLKPQTVVAKTLSLSSAAGGATSSLAVHNSLIQAKKLGEFGILPTMVELELTFRLVYASLFGALIGYERSTSDRPAGIRTMSLVSLGAAVFTLCSMYGFVGSYDTSRMASNVASGVGFIGAGVITNKRNQNGVREKTGSVKGLTTAAAIWVSAAVGVSAGTGLYFLSMFASISTIIVLRLGKLHLYSTKDVREGNVKLGNGEVVKEVLKSSDRKLSIPTYLDVAEEMEIIKKASNDKKPRNK